MELSDKKFTEISDRYSGFKFGVMQAFNQIIDISYRYGFTINELYEYVEENKRQFAKGANFHKDIMAGDIKLRMCPDCGRQLLLESVNDSPRTMVGGKWKSVFTCIDMQSCGYQEFNKLSPGRLRYEILKENGTLDKYIPNRHPHGVSKIPEVLKELREI